MAATRRPGEEPAVVVMCSSLHRALEECYRRVKDPIQREAFCRHLNRRLAECLVAAACPDESEAMRVMCSSSGTAQKRARCREARLRLSTCLSSLQISPD